MAGKGKARMRTTEARENQIANMALDLAEKQIKDGTASATVITHFLKLITTREKLENERLKMDLQVAEAKIKQMDDAVNLKELFANAIKAMKVYSGYDGEDDEYEEEDIPGSD